MRSIIYSLNHILKNRHVNRPVALWRYGQWQMIKVLNLFPRVIPVSASRVRIADKKMALEGGTKIYTQGMYDYNNMQLVKLLSANGVGPMLDVGANLGLYSLIASEAPPARVFAFEPHPHTFAVLKEQIDLNGRTNITPVNLAVSDAEKTVLFTDDAGSSVNKIVEGDEGPGLIRIQACRLDAFCRAQGIRPRLVKMDVEGFELEALTGFGESLQEVDVLLIEISREQGRVHALLQQRGLLGPYSVDLATKRLVPRGQSESLEDPVYVNGKFLPHLKSDFGIDAQAFSA